MIVHIHDRESNDSSRDQTTRIALVLTGIPDRELGFLPKPLADAFDSNSGRWSVMDDESIQVEGFISCPAHYSTTEIDGVTVKITCGQEQETCGTPLRAGDPAPDSLDLTATYEQLAALIPEPVNAPIDEPEPVRLARLGYEVFPLISAGKAPNGEVCPNGFHDATSDPERVAQWFADVPGCNWGMRTHHLVVDVDSYALQLEGQPDWPNDPDQAADLANAGAIAITRNGGHHYHFAMPPGKTWGATAGAVADHIDIRAGGKGYVVIPPSRIDPSPGCSGDGQYRWVDGYELTVPTDKLPMPPAWLIEVLDRVSSTRATGEGTSITVEDRAALEPVADKGVRTWVNTSPQFWQQALELLLANGAKIIHSKGDGTVYLCRPGKSPKDGSSATWDAPKARDGKHGFPRLYVFTPNWPPFESANGYSAWDVITMIDQLGAEVRLVDAYERFRASKFPEITPAEAGLVAVAEAAPAYESAIDAVPFPMEVADSFRRGGILDLFIREVEQREFKRQPIVRVAFGLSLLSAVIGRGVKLRCDTMANLYILVTLPSGEGKDAARKLANLLIDRTKPGLSDELHPAYHSLIANWPHSGSALMSLLMQRPDRWIFVDEIGGFLHSGRQNQNGNTGQLLTYLTMLFTHGPGQFTGQAYADSKRNGKSVDTPWVSLLGVTAPRKLVDSLSRESLEDGLLPRMLWLPGDEFPELCSPHPGKNMSELPVDLVDQVRAWRAPRDTAFTWTLTLEADAFLHEQRLAWETQKRDYYAKGATEATLFTRCAEIAKRVAILFSADQLERPRDDNQVTLKNVQIACQLVNWSTQNFVRLCQESLADSEIGRAENVILGFLRRSSPDRWLSLEDIRTGCRRKALDDARTRNAILDDLTKRGLIERQEVSVNGRPLPRFRLCRS